MAATTPVMIDSLMAEDQHPMTPLDIFLDIALPYVLMALLLIAMILMLRLWKKQVWWCKCAKLMPFSCQVKSMHNSQHIADQYTLDHILHGVIFYWIVHYIPVLTIHHKALLVFFTAFLWEVIENSEFIIKKYRENTISYGYEGDSIANSVFDSIFCMGGFAFAYFTPWYFSLIFGIIVEVLLAFWIRDNMIINAIMLVYPVPAIKAWQDELEKKYHDHMARKDQTANGNGSNRQTEREPEHQIQGSNQDYQHDLNNQTVTSV